HEVRHGTECERYVITELHAERFPVQHMLDFCRRSISPEFDEYEVFDHFEPGNGPVHIPQRIDFPCFSDLEPSHRYLPFLRFLFFWCLCFFFTVWPAGFLFPRPAPAPARPRPYTPCTLPYFGRSYFISRQIHTAAARTM